MRRGRRSIALVLIGAALACGERHGAKAPAQGGTTTAATAPSASAAESVAAARDEWNVAEVVRRLEEAGLVVSDSGQAARRDRLGAGHLLHVSGGTLELYFYSGTDARRHAEQGIDTTTHGLPSISTPRYIFSGNLIAVLTTPKDALAERVENVLTARHNGGGS